MSESCQPNTMRFCPLRVRARHCCLALTLIQVLAFRAVGAEKGGRGSNTDLFRVIAGGYAANREAFQFGECRMRIRQGTAKSVDDALAGRLSAVIEHEVHWVFDGQSVLLTDESTDPKKFDALIKETRKKRPPQQHEMYIPFIPECLMSTGAVGVRYGRLLGAASLYPGERLRPMVEVDPFSIGLMGAGATLNPAFFMNGVADGKFVGHIHDNSGNPKEFVVSVDVEGYKPFEKYWINSERGFQLSRIDLFEKDGKVATRAYTTDQKEVSGDRWFPMRRLKVSVPDGTGPYSTTEYQIVSANFDKHPPSSAFEVLLPEGTAMRVDGVAGPSVTTKQDVAVGLGSLSSFVEEIRQKQEFPPPKALPASLPSASGSTLWKSLLVVNFFALAVCVVVWLLKVRRAHKNSD